MTDRLSEHGRNVWGCVVCFRTTAASLKSLLDVLEPQVGQILLIDNSPEFSGRLPQLANSYITYLPMPANVGTAGAMNEAWRLAAEAGVEYMISFDYDSRPGPGLVDGLMASLAKLADAGVRVAAIGPRKIDPRTGRPLRLLLPVTFFKRYASSDAKHTVEVDHIISSGCLIGAEAFRDIGPYRPSLFLDYVDIEWCLRARAKGYAIVCDPSLSMLHVIGEQVVRVGRWSVWIHQPMRTGLLIRNHFLLWREPAVSAAWLLVDLRQVLLKIVVQLCAGPERRNRLRWIWRGLSDGLCGRGGPW